MSGGHGPGTSGENRTLPRLSAQIFSYAELAAATKNFSEDLLLGHGQLGYVYKGSIDNGQAVAIKQIDRSILQGDREFLVEVLMLNLIHHKHIVNLIGYCTDGDHRMIVYEFMALGSLRDHLHDLPPDKEPLDWKTRIRIAAGAAEGLEHLHDHVSPPVIYRGLKSSSVLLGEGYFPKLSDFGLAKLGPVGDKTYVATRVMGTMAYCDPEYAVSGKLSVKSDIYSFGVVLLEIISGRRAYDPTRPALEQHLVAWAHPLLKDPERFDEMADPSLKGQYPQSGFSQALAIAAICLQEHAASRPSAHEVMTALLNLASEAGNDNNGSPSVPESPTEAPSD